MSPQNAAGFTEQIQPGAFTQSLPNAPEWVKRLLDPDEALKLALELIGRRSDVVAVQLPEPAGVNGQDNHTWNHSRHYIEQEFNGDVIIDDRLGIDACDLADLGAIFLAAASRADAANVADAAEDGGK